MTLFVFGLRPPAKYGDVMFYALLVAALMGDPSRFTVETESLPVVPQVTPVNPWLPPVPNVPNSTRRLYVFGYDQCGPCRSSRPNLDSWLKTAGLSVTVPTANSECVYVDGQLWPKLASQWKVEGYPTVIVHDDLKEVARHVGAYTVDDLNRLWNTGRNESREGHVSAALSAGAGTEYTLPRVSINPTTKAVTILETVEIPYGNFVTMILSKDCVLNVGNDGQCDFSQPYPKIRTRPFRWDGDVKGFKLDTTARTAVLQINGFPDQTIRY